MTTTTPDDGRELTASSSIERTATRRVKGEALGLVLGVFVVLFGLTLVLGGPLPVWR